MNSIKEEIIEQFQEEFEEGRIAFLPGQDDKLIGYAEMFGKDCILLYKDINVTFLYPEKAIEEIHAINPQARTHDGSDSSIIGHLKLEDGSTILLYDKEALIEGIKQDYMKDDSGLFEGEEDCETSAVEWYYVNSLGSYMDGIPAFAVMCDSVYIHH